MPGGVKEANDMSGSRYRFLAALSADDGRALDQVPISPDWYPATESARFRALRRSTAPVKQGAAEFVPVWDADLGMPYLSGVTVGFADSTEVGAGCLVPLSYFRAEVQSFSS